MVIFKRYLFPLFLKLHSVLPKIILHMQMIHFKKSNRISCSSAGVLVSFLQLFLAAQSRISKREPCTLHKSGILQHHYWKSWVVHNMSSLYNEHYVLTKDVRNTLKKLVYWLHLIFVWLILNTKVLMKRKIN